MSYQIIPYEEKAHHAAYERLNREWIEREFRIEKHDLAIFRSPREYIVDKGGYIFMAEKGGEVIGTCSSIKLNEGAYELAKLAVTGVAQGLGIGKALCVAVIEKAKALGADEVIITTNTKLQTALTLYERLGFVTSPKPYHEHYERCNTTLVLRLE